MDYCGPRGLPYTQFLHWDEYSRQAAMAWIIDERVRCSSCGTYPQDWIDPDTLIPFEKPPYMARAEMCIGCQTLDEERKRLPEDRQGQYRLHLERFDEKIVRSELEAMTEAAQQPEE